MGGRVLRESREEAARLRRTPGMPREVPLVAGNLTAGELEAIDDDVAV